MLRGNHHKDATVGMKQNLELYCQLQEDMIALLEEHSALSEILFGVSTIPLHSWGVGHLNYKPQGDLSEKFQLLCDSASEVDGFLIEIYIPYHLGQKPKQ